MSILLPLFITWAKGSADRQLEKIQQVAYDTPGAESPVPPQVILGSIGLIGGHFLLGRGIMKQKMSAVLLAFFLGCGIGLSTYLLSKRVV